VISFAAVLASVLSLNMGLTFDALMVIAGLGLSLAVLFFFHERVWFYMIISLGFAAGAMERVFMGKYPFTSIVLGLPCVLICLVFIKEAKRRDFSWIPGHPILYVYLLLTAYLVVEIFNPQMDSFLGWFSAFWQRLAYLFFLLVSCYIFRDLRSIRFFFKFFIVAIFLTALYGCVQQWIGLSPFDARWVHSDPHIYGLYSLPGGGLRKFSFLSDPANFGTLMAGGTVAALILFVMGPFTRRRKVLLGIFTIIILLGMSYSGTRTANFMIVAGLGLYILMTMYMRRTRILACVAGISFLLVLSVPIYNNVTLNRFRSAFNGSPTDDPSYDTRLIHRNMMQPYMHQHPFGGGVNTAGNPGAKYNPHHYLAGFPPDGAYFATALNLGWVGLILDCTFFFLILFYGVHYFYKCQNKEIKTYYAVAAVFLFSLFLGSYAQFTITSVPQSLIFIPFIAAIIKLHTFDTPELSKNLQKSQNP